MIFTKALYYPWIDISNEGWLKNAMLYWDTIQTIVPNSIAEPYRTRTALEFYDEGLLSPFRVESDMKEIEELKDDVFEYLKSPEGSAILMGRESSESNPIHFDKLPEDVKKLIEIHPNKLPYEIQRRLQDVFPNTQNNDWINVDARFANFYMTLLATHLSDKIGAGLLTSSMMNSKLAKTVRLDPGVALPEDVNQRNVSRHLAQGTLANLIIDKIQVAPDTPVKKILKFRRDYADELTVLRRKIAELTSTISNIQSIENFYQQINDIYMYEVKPAMNSLKAGLTDSRIRWEIKVLLHLTAFYSSSPFVSLGLNVPKELLIATGVSLTAFTILYNLDKKQQLRRNPFSYLMETKRVFQ